MRATHTGCWRPLVGGLLSLAIGLTACGTNDASRAVPQTTIFDQAEDASAGAEADISGEVKGVRMQTGDDCAGPILCVGLVTEAGPLGRDIDARSTWDAMQSFDGANARIKRIETTNASNFAANLAAFADEGFDVIVSVGSALGEATVSAAQANPDIDYIGVGQFHAAGTPNLAGLTFASDHAGFLAGALAGRISETRSITAILGSEIVLEDLAFADGFRAGAQHVEPGIEAQVVFYPGGLHEVGGDPAWGAATALEAIEAGADVIVARHDETGLAAFGAAAKQAALCVGADLDLSATPGSLNECIVGTAINRTTQGVARLLEDAVSTSLTAGPSTGSTSVAPSVHGPKIDADIESELAGLATDLRNGSLAAGQQPAPVPTLGVGG